MRIYKRDEFLKLPAGTIYAKGKPCYFDGFNVKFDTLTSNGHDVDWVCLSPMWIEAHDSGEAFDRFDEMLEHGASYPMQESAGRDALYDKDEIFLVPEREDLLKLKALIEAAIAVSDPNPSPPDRG